MNEPENIASAVAESLGRGHQEKGVKRLAAAIAEPADTLPQRFGDCWRKFNALLIQPAVEPFVYTGELVAKDFDGMRDIPR